MISTMIPEPYRRMLIDAGEMAGVGNRSAEDLAEVAAIVDLIRAKCARDYPHLFKQENTND